MFCGECVPHTMQEEFFESREVRLFLHLRTMQEPGLLKTLERSMNLGGTRSSLALSLRGMIYEADSSNCAIFSKRASYVAAD